MAIAKEPFMDSGPDLVSIVSNYTSGSSGRLDAGERLRCYRCEARTGDFGTPQYVWATSVAGLPGTIELCQLCHTEASALKLS